MKLVVTERETGALRTYLKERPLRLSSRIATVEVARTAGRLKSASTAPLSAAFEGVAIVELDRVIGERAGGMRPPLIRSLDAIHISSALSMADELDAFVTYDTRLAGAARAAGLTVLSPA